MLFLGGSTWRRVGSSAGKKVRTFGVGGTCKRQGGRSSRQASDTGVVPTKGSPILKSAICGNFGRVTVRQSGASVGFYCFERVSSFGREEGDDVSHFLGICLCVPLGYLNKGEGVSALLLAVLMLDMLVGAVRHSLVPQVGKLEVAATLGRYGSSWVIPWVYDMSLAVRQGFGFGFVPSENLV
ncbi:unnamed protein product [Prunus armeniaca]